MKFPIHSLIFDTVLIPFSESAAEYEIQKPKHGQWFIYEGDVKTGLHVNSTSDPQCYEFADILIFLKDRSQALDTGLLQNSARIGLANYHAYCAKKTNKDQKLGTLLRLLLTILHQIILAELQVKMSWCQE